MNGGRRAINPGRATHKIKMDQIVKIPKIAGAATAMKMTDSQIETAEGSLSVVIALGVMAMP